MEEVVEKKQYILIECPAGVTEAGAAMFAKSLSDLKPPTSYELHIFVKEAGLYEPTDTQTAETLNRLDAMTRRLTATAELLKGEKLEGNCTACSFEAEHGTEECPHPVDQRMHSCPPLCKACHYDNQRYEHDLKHTCANHGVTNG